MVSSEAHMHVFVVRLWLEVREIPGAAPEWRGMIEHVPSGQYGYLRELGEVLAFVAPFLADAEAGLEDRP